MKVSLFQRKGSDVNICVGLPHLFCHLRAKIGQIWEGFSPKCDGGHLGNLACCSAFLPCGKTFQDCLRTWQDYRFCTFCEISLPFFRLIANFQQKIAILTQKSPKTDT